MSRNEFPIFYGACMVLLVLLFLDVAKIPLLKTIFMTADFIENALLSLSPSSAIKGLLLLFFLVAFTIAGLGALRLLWLIIRALIPLLRFAFRLFFPERMRLKRLYRRFFEKYQSFEKIDAMKGEEFELFSAGLLARLGFKEIETTEISGDQGIDLFATFQGERYGFQCKRWRSSVGNSAVQEAHAGKAYYKLDRAIVITNSRFTQSAKALAKETNVELWDRQILREILHRYGR